MFKKEMMVLLALAVLAPAAFAEEKPAVEAAPTAKTEAPAAATNAAPVEQSGPASAAVTEKAEVDSVEGRMLLTQKLPYDVVYGKDDAMITITEYASLSCPHCRDFYTTIFTKLKENYIDTGKVKYVFRHYPLNINALRGAMVLECGIPEEKKNVFLGAMFESQPEWAYKEDEKDVIAKLKSIAKLGGFDDSKFDACAKDKTLEDAMLRQQLQTQKALGVSSTPTVYIGDKKYFDKKDYDTFAKAVEDAFTNLGKESPAETVDPVPAQDKPAEEKKVQ